MPWVSSAAVLIPEISSSRNSEVFHCISVKPLKCQSLIGFTVLLCHFILRKEEVVSGSNNLHYVPARPRRPSHLTSAGLEALCDSLQEERWFTFTLLIFPSQPLSVNEDQTVVLYLRRTAESIWRTAGLQRDLQHHGQRFNHQPRASSVLSEELKGAFCQITNSFKYWNAVLHRQHKYNFYNV